MPSFHVLLQARPSQTLDAGTLSAGDRELPAVRLEPSVRPPLFDLTFEQAIERLEELPRMFVEPDGSFVWVSRQGPGAWQIDGQLNDGPQRLMNVELKGHASREQVQQLLSLLGWPQTSLLVQFVQQGLYTEVEPFLESLADE
jgi:hypothetical protein